MFHLLNREYHKEQMEKHGFQKNYLYVPSEAKTKKEEECGIDEKTSSRRTLLEWEQTSLIPEVDVDDTCEI
jgi:hypothetical protein